MRDERRFADGELDYRVCLEGAARVRIDPLRAALKAGAVEAVLDVAVGIDNDGRLIPAASIGQRQ